MVGSTRRSTKVAAPGHAGSRWAAAFRLRFLHGRSPSDIRYPPIRVARGQLGGVRADARLSQLTPRHPAPIPIPCCGGVPSQGWNGSRIGDRVLSPIPDPQPPTPSGWGYPRIAEWLQDRQALSPAPHLRPPSPVFNGGSLEQNQRRFSCEDRRFTSAEVLRDRSGVS